MSYYRTQLEDFLKTLYIKADTVFDIGGAQGEIKPRVTVWDVQHYKVLDLPMFNLEWEMSDDLIDQCEKADIIFCLEVFEYLINPYQAIQNISSLLKPNGRAYITFAFAYPHHEELELDALRYTEPGIKRLTESAGLKIKSTWYRVDKSGLLQSFYSADGMHPSKNYNHHNVTGFIVEVAK